MRAPTICRYASGTCFAGTKVLACCYKGTNTDAEARTNNLQRIESVERLLYAGPPPGVTKKVDKNKFMQRPITLTYAGVC
jgi:hypothetical protein